MNYPNTPDIMQRMPTTPMMPLLTCREFATPTRIAQAAPPVIYRTSTPTETPSKPRNSDPTGMARGQRLPLRPRRSPRHWRRARKIRRGRSWTPPIRGVRGMAGGGTGRTARTPRSRMNTEAGDGARTHDPQLGKDTQQEDSSRQVASNPHGYVTLSGAVLPLDATNGHGNLPRNLPIRAHRRA